MVLQSQLELTPHRPDRRSLHVEKENEDFMVKQKRREAERDKKRKGSGLCVRFSGGAQRFRHRE